MAGLAHGKQGETAALFECGPAPALVTARTPRERVAEQCLITGCPQDFAGTKITFEKPVLSQSNPI